MIKTTSITAQCRSCKNNITLEYSKNNYNNRNVLLPRHGWWVNPHYAVIDQYKKDHEPQWERISGAFVKVQPELSRYLCPEHNTGGCCNYFILCKMDAK